MKLFLLQIYKTKKSKSYTNYSVYANDNMEIISNIKEIANKEIDYIKELTEIKIDDINNMCENENYKKSIDEALCNFVFKNNDVWINSRFENPNYNILNLLLPLKIQILSFDNPDNYADEFKNKLHDYLFRRYSVPYDNISCIHYNIKNSNNDIDIDALESLITPDTIKVLVINCKDIKFSTLNHIYDVYKNKYATYRLQLLMIKNDDTLYELVYGKSDIVVKEINL